MAFDNPSNRGRADKIAEIVAHVKKSAQSNKATPEEIAEIMAPAVAALREIGAIPSAIVLPPAPDTQITTEEVDAIARAEMREGTEEPSHFTPDYWARMRSTPEVRALRAGQRAALHLTSQASMRDLICALMGKLEAQAEALEPQAEEGV